LYKERGEVERGIEVLSEGISYNDQCEFLYYNRSCFLSVLNKIEVAAKDLIKAVELYPGFIKYINEDDELEETRNNKLYLEFINNIDI
jgi:hypothetical protein